VSLKYRIAKNWNDVWHFGPSVLLRHAARHKRDSRIAIWADGLGRIIIRAGDSDIETLRQALVERQYSLEWPKSLKDRIDARYDEILAAGGKPIIVDAGANIGAAALYFLSRFPKAHIVAVEPDPGNAAILRENLASRSNAVVMEAAIGAEPGHVALTSPKHSWAVRTERSDAGVPVVTVQDALEASVGNTPFIVKVDIEGFEEELFAKNTAWIDDTFAIFVEPHDWMIPERHSSKSFQQAMAKRAFKIYIRFENLLYVRA
jgi:FkbM family methyltransferase